MRVPRCSFRIAAVILMASAAVASARLGETLEQLTARFGKPTQTVTPKPSSIDKKEYVFHKGGFVIDAYFRGKACEKITYTKETWGSLSDEEIAQLLKSNGIWIEETAPTWDLVKNRQARHKWRRDDNQAWAEQGLYFPNLTIMTFDYMQAEADAAAAAKQKVEEAARAKKLDGF